MPGQMCYRRLVEPRTSVDVHSIYNLIGRLCAITGGGIGHFVLPCGSEQQAPIGREGQPTEEGR